MWIDLNKRLINNTRNQSRRVNEMGKTRKLILSKRIKF